MNTWEVKNEQVSQTPKEKFWFLPPSHSSWTLLLEDKEDVLKACSRVSRQSLLIICKHSLCAHCTHPRMMRVCIRDATTIMRNAIARISCGRKRRVVFCELKTTQEHSWNKRSPGWEAGRAQQGSQRQKKLAVEKAKMPQSACLYAKPHSCRFWKQAVSSSDGRLWLKQLSCLWCVHRDPLLMG